jgi:thioesterase domain-containing protein
LRHLMVGVRDYFFYSAPMLLLCAAGLCAELFPERMAFFFHMELIFALRIRALREMTEQPLNAAVTLFRSTEYQDRSPDFGWARFCSQLNIIIIGGDHTTIIQPPILSILRDRVVEEIKKSVRPLDEDA